MSRFIAAIGDIHGKSICLDNLLGKIKDEFIQSKSNDGLLITLGDYVNRGDSSRRVIDLLIEGVEGLSSVNLTGNHDYYFARAIMQVLSGDPSGDDVLRWMSTPCTVPTVKDYGVDWWGHVAVDVVSDPHAYRELAWHAARHLVSAMPDEHIRWLMTLRPRLELGKAHFVHAGFRPGIAPEKQSLQDMLLIEEDFTHSRERFSKPIYHGHSITYCPEDQGHRICLDTGSYLTGIITAAILDEDGRPKRFLAGCDMVRAPVFVDAISTDIDHKFTLWADWAAQVAQGSGRDEVDVSVLNARRLSYLERRFSELGVRPRLVDFEEVVDEVRYYGGRLGPEVEGGPNRLLLQSCGRSIHCLRLAMNSESKMARMLYTAPTRIHP